MDRIAALLTCYNRKDKTKSCLDSLYKITLNVDVYIVDDNSMDGTPDLVKARFPQVHLIQGTGNLFWNRGMHRAWVEALKGDYDCYLWLNDDIELYDYFLDELLKCEEEAGGNSIVAGIILDKDTKQVIYGGTDKENNLYQVDGEMHDIKDMNGNVVLVPREVVNTIGIIDPTFHHFCGDTDYGYSAKRAGIKVLTTRRAVAQGYDNPVSRVRKWNTNIVKRYKYLYSPFGMSPRIGFYFYNKHFGFVKGLIYWAYLHVINIMPDTIAKKIVG